ncbi:hypothetical protein HYW74_02665 [Candidatus Pacearchaeota archaeon]|nr:hypothetical protein [Candidatus Pacearchaeota archaeon]
MSSFLFEAHVSAITDALIKALPRLRKEFGESLSLEEVTDTIGTGILMHSSFENSLGGGLGILTLYKQALEENKNPLNPPYFGEGI